MTQLMTQLYTYTHTHIYIYICTYTQLDIHIFSFILTTMGQKNRLKHLVRNYFNNPCKTMVDGGQ